MPQLSDHRVLVLHNRYRTAGGEERCVEHLLEIMPTFGGAAELLERRSEKQSRLQAGRGMIRGGIDPEEVGRAVREYGATVVHAHNIHPSFGFRALEAAREAGAATVLHLHNYRLYCAIGTVYRNDADCTLCAPRNMKHGVLHNCRGSVPEALAYAWGLSRGQQRTIAATDRMISPVRQLAENLSEELEQELPTIVMPYWLPDSEFANSSEAGAGEYALLAGRLAREKGVLTAIEAAAISEVPLLLAGVGPALEEARRFAERLGAPVEFAGRLEGQALVAARMGAAFSLLPSLWREVLPFSGLEALAAGLPLVTSERGGLPEQTEPDLVTRTGDAKSLAAKMAELFADRELRQAAGERALARARERFSQPAVAPQLARVYDEAVAARNSAMR